MQKTDEFLNMCTKNIDKQLFGRSKESIELTNIYRNVEQGTFEVVFISGLSGIGKTAFVRHAIKHHIGENMFYIYGKCNQYSQEEPYQPFIEAFRMLINQILTEPEEIMQGWRKRIISTIGENCSILMNMIPELELILGKVPKLKITDSHKLKARLGVASRKLIHLLTDKDHPFIMVFDDLQWADSETLQLIDVIMSDSSNQYLCLINIFRTEELHSNNLLKKIIKSLDKTGINLFTLDALTFHDTKELLEHRYHYNQEQMIKLTKSIYRKTLGNPFYIEQIITALENKVPMVTSNQKKLKWMIEYINELTIDDNILELIINRLKMLPKELVQLLVHASYLGRKFDIKTLSIILNTIQEQIYHNVKILVERGFFMPLTNMSDNKQQHTSRLSDMEFEFSHDRIQQASYELIPVEERKAYHLNIGRALLDNLDEKSVNSKILNIMPHFNKALDLIKMNTERHKTISLNLLAGKKAKKFAAYQSALEYLQSAMTLLPNNAWKKYYDLCFDLHFELAECEFLCNNISNSEVFFEILIENAKNKNQKSDIYAKRTVLYSCNGQYVKAIETGIKALKNIDEYVPKKVTQYHILKEVIEALWRFRDSKFSRFEKSTQAPPQKVDRTIELLCLLAPSASFADKDLYILLIIKMANLSAKYGTTAYSTIGYCGYSIVLGSILGNFKKADKLKELALSLCDTYGDKSLRCMVYVIVGAFIHHWTHDLEECIQILKEAYELGIDSGEYMFAGYSITLLVELNIYTGKYLNDVEKICKQYFNFSNKMQFYTLLNSYVTGSELAKFLQYEEETGDYYLNNTEIEFNENIGDIICYYLFKAQILYLINRYEEALDAIEISVKRLITGYYSSAEINFYHSLILAACYNRSLKNNKNNFIKKIKRNQKQMKKWAENSPKNFKHKYLLIEAELNRCQRNEILTSKLYDEAIKLALDNKFIQDLAIANECAAKYYLSNGLEKIASIYLKEAYQNYHKWGAHRKTKDLIEKHKELIEIKIEKHHEEVKLVNIKDIENSNAAQEWDSMIVEYLQDIVNVNDDNDLLSVFLNKTMELSKVNRGYVFIEINDNLHIEAFNDNNKHIRLKAKMEEIHDLPKKVIRYTKRTYKKVILNPQEQVDIFYNDRYISKKGEVALASIPLKVNKIFIGVLYLEDTEHAKRFTPDLVNKINVLTAQLSYMKRVQTLYEMENVTGIEPTQQPLSQREIEILLLISNGKTNKQIAKELYLTINTVKSHASNIYSKLEVNSRLQAVMQARKIGIIQ